MIDGAQVPVKLFVAGRPVGRAAQKRKVGPRWQRLQSAKSSPPKARRLLWHVIQLCARPEAKCWVGRGEVTCLDCGAPARTLWHSAQLKPCRGPCAAWLKLTLKAREPVEVRLNPPGAWHAPHEEMSRPPDCAPGVWH